MEKNLTELLKKLHSGRTLSNQELLEIHTLTSRVLSVIAGQGDFFYPIVSVLKTDLDTVSGYLLARNIEFTTPSLASD